MNQGGISTLYPDEAKEYIDGHAEGSYTLLDVRQPEEYEESRLPGAKLVPLPELADSTGELDPEKPVVVYCAMGGRSLAAAQFLVHRGFREVYQVEGGIQAWEATIANGPRGFHLEFLRGNEPPEEIVRTAWLMEEGLKRFHQAVLDITEEPKLAKLLRNLVSAEEKHERNLLEMLPEGPMREKLAEELAGAADLDLMEGGANIAGFMEQNGPFLKAVAGYLDVAMMIETQALDLYLHMAEGCTNQASKRILLRIADEEKGHLVMLGRAMDDEVANPAR